MNPEQVRLRYLEQIPRQYEKIREFRALGDSSDVLTKSLYDFLAALYEEQFIMTCSRTKLEEFEHMYGIIPDLSTDTLQFRRERIISRRREILPYNRWYLKQAIDKLAGNELTSLQVDFEQLTLDVDIHLTSANLYKVIVDLMERIVPLNMLLTPDVQMLSELLELSYWVYDFPVKYKRTNDFHTAEVNGSLGTIHYLGAEYDVYQFNTRQGICGVMITGEAVN